MSYCERLDSGGEIAFTNALGVLAPFSLVVKDKDDSLDMHRLVQLVTRKWLIQQETVSQFARSGILAIHNVLPSYTFEIRDVYAAALPHITSLLDFDSTIVEEEQGLRKSHLLHHFAVYLHDQAQWGNAVKYQTEVLELNRLLHQDEHPDTLASMGNLALTYQNQGRWKEAEELEIQVLETRKKVLGEEHPDTLISMGNLASTYRNQGRWKEAEELQIQVLETRKKVLGEEHPDTLTSMGISALL
jgi:tetratricopeptide (TPR) repeat protein